MVVILKPGLRKPWTMKSSCSFLFLDESNGDNQQSDHGNHVWKTVSSLSVWVAEWLHEAEPPLPPWLKLHFIITEQKIYSCFVWVNIHFGPICYKGYPTLIQTIWPNYFFLIALKQFYNFCVVNISTLCFPLNTMLHSFDIGFQKISLFYKHI